MASRVQGVHDYEPSHLLFVPLRMQRISEAAEGIVRTIENTMDEPYAAIFREHPFLEPKNDVDWLRHLLDRGDLGAALELH